MHCHNDVNVYSVNTLDKHGAGFPLDSAGNEVTPAVILGIGTFLNTIIDFIFINDKVKAHKYRVCKDKINGNYASDHFAIWADLEY